MRSLAGLMALAALLAGGGVHSVKGDHMKIKIQRSPLCLVDVLMDGVVVFKGKAVKPCPKP